MVAYATSMNDTGIFDATDDCVSNNSCYAVGGGTSYAAPFVSGGLALLAQHFNNQLGNTEILQRVLMTADKSGMNQLCAHARGRGCPPAAPML